MPSLPGEKELIGNVDDLLILLQVEEIQEGLLGLLHTQYRNLNITKGYLDSEEE